MDYAFPDIEKKWLQKWEETRLYKVKEDTSKPKYYVLDMFPYPSGSGLHVGHPLGYVASDIVSRYKRLNGFNVLHPMGFDAFGLPAEQYAIETGTHPRTTTLKNIDYFRSQLRRMGFSYDWSREVVTCDPGFYKWTQWIFMQLFNCWYDPFSNKAQPLETLIAILEQEGSEKLFALDKCDRAVTPAQWKGFSATEQQQFLMQFRLAYLDYADVWWCEALGTVLANDEVKDGVSERGGHPVEKVKLRQWFLRITEYADRLLAGLDTLEWSEAMKEMQRNWIGRSEGALVEFRIAVPIAIGSEMRSGDDRIQIFTTRPDTIFGATFMVLAPEHELVEKITTEEQRADVEKYIAYVKSRSERDRMTEVKKVTGQFTGAYAVNPFTEKEIPIYIAEYVLAGYGTGAIMAVPSNDDRDHAFAEKFGLEIIPVVDQSMHTNATREDKVGTMVNSGMLNNMEVKDAIRHILTEIETKKIGRRKINYRLRDAGFSRQRYWGEPFPVYYKNGENIPHLIPENELPLLLPEVESYKPGGSAKSPLAAVTDWVNYNGGMRETDTMPGYAASSWYFYRYMDIDNQQAFAAKEKIDYWQNVDLYIGGTEHAVGHLLYSRMWNKFLFDRGLVMKDEPFQKLVNQGMIQGISQKIIIQTSKNMEPFVDLIQNDWTNKTLPAKQIFYSYDLIESLSDNGIEFSDDYNIPADCVNDNQINFDKLLKDKPSLIDSIFICRNGFYMYGKWENQTGGIQNKFLTNPVAEKMSKSKRNTVDPTDVIDQYGADCFRLYEMFLGPLDASKPWDTKGISGVSTFLRRVWRLCYDEKNVLRISNEAATKQELNILHKTIKKVGEDIEKLSFNTAVSAFMICVNELNELKCHKKEIVKDLLVVLAPFAPFITEELWEQLGGEGSVHTAAWPAYNESYLQQDTFNYPIQVNGKLRDNVELPLDMPKEEIEKQVMALESILKWTEGKPPKKIVVVPGKIVNVVV